MSCRVRLSRGALPALRIPMRGYEMTDLMEIITTRCRYESPCGVMRIFPLQQIPVIIALRIPMRGYEASDFVYT